MLLMLLAPHPSWLTILVHHHLLTLKSSVWFAIHLSISYTLMFLACTSLIVCLARDPGPISSPEDVSDDNEETSLAEALMAPIAGDFNTPDKWCKKCWAAKPERTHHCSICKRCVLKMGASLAWPPLIPVLTDPWRVDHHCQWMSNKCIVSSLRVARTSILNSVSQGHRTYPAFVHFLTCVVLMAMYMGGVALSSFYYAFTNPMDIVRESDVKINVCHQHHDRTKPRRCMNWGSGSPGW